MPSSNRRSRANPPELLSVTLERWLKGKSSKSLLSLTQLFADKAFAIIFLLLMALPALPIPTGGVTHVTEIITMLLSLELIIGRRTIWLPKRWLAIDVDKHLTPKATRRLLGTVRWFERFSRRRGSGLLAQPTVLSLLGVVVFLFTVAAFLVPPFSGLDTLPALGVVIISLGLILEDFLLAGIGFVIGTIGIGVAITAGSALYSGLKHLF